MFKVNLFFILLILICRFNGSAQQNFNYELALEPIAISSLPGLHSYAFGQHNGKWLIIGGRLDGVHTRQPFNAFPEAKNNKSIFVVDVVSQQLWSSPLASLPTGIQEQLQATNMNFYQDEDSLYVAGGYAFSGTANSHITFPYLTSIQVSSVINAIISGNSLTAYFKQISDSAFAITGGQLGKIGNTFYLVGGHRFDGQYNPMGNPTFTQKYSNQIRKFSIDNSGSQLSFNNYTTITDPVHLRRRDYNLLPQIFPNGTPGYTISSGVFQIGVDLPFLYPVDITASGYSPVTTFNQYLSNYHSAKACLYDSINNEMHNLFFGGISQYYYQNGNLVQDNQVPFVKTISRLTRFGNGSLQEYQLPVEMPGLKGAGAEFILNQGMPHYSNEVIRLNDIKQDTILIGHIFGGILSPGLHPFNNNQTNTTGADPTIFAVKLIKNAVTGVQPIDGENPYSFEIFPNPIKSEIYVSCTMQSDVAIKYYLTNLNGQLLQHGAFRLSEKGSNQHCIKLDKNLSSQPLFLTLVAKDKFYYYKKLIKQ